MTLIAAIYARVSTGRQAGDDKVSLVDQQRQCQDRATSDGYEVPGALIFTDKVSGGLGEAERPGFKAMMDAARAHSYQRVYFYNGTRFARDDAVATSAFKELRSLGVEYVSLRDPDLQHTLTRGMVIAFGQYEKELIRERTMKGKNAKREQGKFVTGTIPFGFKRGSNQTLALCEIEGPVLRRIYEETIKGHGRIAIVRQFNHEGIAPPFAWVQEPGKAEITRLRMNQIGGFDGLERWLTNRPEAKLVRPPRWSDGVVSQLIKKTVNYGVLAGRKVTIEGGPPITQTMFDAAQAASASRHMKGASPRKRKLLTGKIRCGNPDCRRHYAYHQSGRKEKPSHAYLCIGNRSGTGCTNSTISMRVADEIVLRAVTAYLTERPGQVEVPPTGMPLVPARLDRAAFYRFLMEQGLRKKGELAFALGQAQSALAELEAERKAYTATAIDLKKLGCGDADLAEIAAQLAGLTPKIDTKRRQIDDLMAELSHASADLAADEAEAAEAAAFAEDALWLAPTEQDDILTPLDPRKIIDCLVHEVTVFPKIGGARSKGDPARRLVISLDKSPEALRKVVRMLASASLDRVRSLRNIERRAVRKSDPDQEFEGNLLKIERWAANKSRLGDLPITED